mmetsp:Transcript_62614/g.116477  ORF Transcript_62614/g.116477 Transcript_62614/m.116477 type:complete len:336 (+) Transcript_62614:22-1029(+)
MAENMDGVNCLTPDDLKSFERDGFLVLASVLSPESISELLDLLHKEAANAGSSIDPTAANGAWDAARSGADSNGCVFSFARDASGTATLPLKVHKAQGVALRVPRVLDIPRHPKVASAAAALARQERSQCQVSVRCAGKELDVFGTKYFPVDASSPGSVSWHDDNYYFGTTRSHTISCVCYLRDVDKANGCLRVVPGSHRDSTVGFDRSAHYTTCMEQHGEYIPEEVIVRGPLSHDDNGQSRSPQDVAVPAGSVVLFDANLLHAVWPNTSSGPSERVACHFIPGDLDTSFRDTSFARGSFADRHLIVCADGTVHQEEPHPSTSEAAAKRRKVESE